MTPEQRREFLESRGFHVARKSFAGKSGPLWYVQEDLPLPPAGHKYPDAKKYFIDLVDGRWMRWTTGIWQPWEAGPWHEIAESESAGRHEVVGDSRTSISRRNPPQGSEPARDGAKPPLGSQPQRQLSEERVLVATSGATKQRGLF